MARQPRVQLSVMPKGVEHPGNGRIVDGFESVQLSVMPKGVEHTVDQREAVAQIGGATISDAERR